MNNRSTKREWAEYQHYTWANRANWTNEDWNDYQAGVLPNDFEDDRLIQ